MYIERFLTNTQVAKPPSVVIEEDCDDGISVRAMNCLKNADIYTVDRLCKFTRAELLEIPNLGRKSILEIEEYLERKGRQLAKSPFGRPSLRPSPYQRDGESLTEYLARFRQWRDGFND